MPNQILISMPMSRPNISKAQMDVLVKAGGRRLKAAFTSGRVFGSRQTEGDNGWTFSSDPIHSPLVSDSCLSKRLVLLTHPSNEAKEEVCWSASACTKNVTEKRYGAKIGVRLQSVLEVERQKWQIYFYFEHMLISSLWERTHPLKAISSF